MKSAKAHDDDGAGGSGSSESESSGKSTPRNGNGDESDSTDKASPVDFAELIAKFEGIALDEAESAMSPGIFRPAALKRFMGEVVLEMNRFHCAVATNTSSLSVTMGNDYLPF